jgi:hypothetical protein
VPMRCRARSRVARRRPASAHLSRTARSSTLTGPDHQETERPVTERTCEVLPNSSGLHMPVRLGAKALVADTDPVLGSDSGYLLEWDEWSNFRRSIFVAVVGVAIFGLAFGAYLILVNHEWFGFLPAGWSAFWLTWQYFEWRQLLTQRAAGG